MKLENFFEKPVGPGECLTGKNWLTVASLLLPFMSAGVCIWVEDKTGFVLSASGLVFNGLVLQVPNFLEKSRRTETIARSGPNLYNNSHE